MEGKKRNKREQSRVNETTEQNRRKSSGEQSAGSSELYKVYHLAALITHARYLAKDFRQVNNKVNFLQQFDLATHQLNTSIHKTSAAFMKPELGQASQRSVPFLGQTWSTSFLLAVFLDINVQNSKYMIFQILLTLTTFQK